MPTFNEPVHVEGPLTVEGKVGIGTATARPLAGDGLGIVSSRGHGLTITRPETGSVAINLRNTNGYWHITGPRSYESGNNLSIFWSRSGRYSRRLTIMDNGYIGIGTGKPDHPFHVTTGRPNDWQARFTNGPTNVYLNHAAGYGMHVNTGKTNDAGRYALEVRNVQQSHLYVRDDGNVGIGTRTPRYELDVAGRAHASSFPTSSDSRFKTNVTHVTSVLDKLEGLRSVAFDWNAEYQSLGRATGHREIGLIAQDVEAVFPELVTTWGEESYKAVDYGRLTAVLVEAVRELRAENAKLKQRTEVLEKAPAEG